MVADLWHTFIWYTYKLLWCKINQTFLHVRPEFNYSFWCIAGDLWKYIHDYNAYRNSSHGSTNKSYRANTRGNASTHSSKHKNMFDFIREQLKQMKSSQPMATPHPSPASGVTHHKGWTKWSFRHMWEQWRWWHLSPDNISKVNTVYSVLASLKAHLTV